MNVKFNKSDLSLNVYTSPTLPEIGEANDIVIISETPMTNWRMSPDAPNGIPRTDGDVWIQYSVKGSTFDVLNNNSMMITTLSAKQYVDGKWVDREAMSYQNGQWVAWTIILYDHGVIGESAGSLVQTGIKYGGDAGSCTLTIGETNVRIGTYAGLGALVYFTKKVDLTAFQKLYFYGSVVDKKGDGSTRCCIGVWKAMPTSTDASTEATAAMTGYRALGLHELNIANVSGEHYVGVAVHGFGDTNSPYMEVIMEQMYLK